MTSIVTTGYAHGSLSTYQLLTGATQTQEANQTEAFGKDALPAANKDADQAKVSQLGQLMSKLQQMSSTDPAAFSETAQTIADNLAKSASESADPGQQEAFSYMASKFAEAAETGDMSSLKDIGSGPPAIAIASETGGSAGSDTVTISTQGKDLASQDGSTGNGASTDSETSESTGTENASESSGSGTEAQSSGKAGTANTGASSSNEDSLEEIEEQIEDLKQKIKEMEKKVQQAEQQAKTDESMMDKVKNLNSQLGDLNSQLAELETQKLEAQSESTG